MLPLNLFKIIVCPLTLFFLFYATAVNDQRDVMPPVSILVLYGLVGLYAYLEFYQGVNYFIYNLITRPYRKLKVPIRASFERAGSYFTYGVCSLVSLIMALIAIQLAK